MGCHGDGRVRYPPHALSMQYCAIAGAQAMRTCNVPLPSFTQQIWGIAAVPRAAIAGCVQLRMAAEANADKLCRNQVMVSHSQCVGRVDMPRLLALLHPAWEQCCQGQMCELGCPSTLHHWRTRVPWVTLTHQHISTRCHTWSLRADCFCHLSK